MIKLIGLDMDGTLLNSKHKISERNIRALKKAASGGAKIVLLSGRNHVCMKQYVDELGIKGLTASLNGAYILDNEKLEKVHDLRIDRDTAAEIISHMEAMNIHINYYHDDKIVCSTETEYSLNYGGITGIPIEAVGSLYEYGKDKQPGKLLLIGEREVLEAAKEWMVKNYTGRVNTFFSQTNYLEVIHEQVSKGEALKVIAKHYGLGMDQVMAIGDGENDISMIRAAGVGVAMGNASDEIKEEADFVTLTNDEDGVAHAIEKMII